MNEEIDESEFYHQDFTTASEWEVFIARIEEIINQWKADDSKTNDKETTSYWTIRTETITFVDFDFNLSYHQRIQTEFTNPNKLLFDSDYDFELYDPNKITDHSHLSKWYGLPEFIVLYPSGNAGITSESKIKVLLSSLYVVCGNLDYEVPLFVQIREKWQHCYLGVHQQGTIRTNLEMVHLKYGPRLCQYATGLVDLFKSKIVSSTMETVILVSLKAAYQLNDFGAFGWKQDYPNPDAEAFVSAELYALPFGVMVDPIESLTLNAIWSRLNQRACQDCESLTTFDPLTAEKWTIAAKSAEQAVCLLGDSLTEFFHLLGHSGTIYDILGDFAAAPQASEATSALDVLTEPKVPTISTLLTRAARHSLTRNRRGTNSAPLAEDILVPMLYFLFPDASEESEHAYKNNGEKTELDHECRGFKTCNFDSLVWRLTIVLANSLQSLGGVRAFAHFWYEFVQEMRYRWEKCITIPGLLPGPPDLRTSLLHQKLQMLNCCIDRKHSRENSSAAFNSAENTSSDEENDEFFDCAEKPPSKHSLWNQPVGRLGRFESLTLLATGDPMFIPITQEPVPKSEDQLEEDTDVLLKLGSDAQGSELRAKMMSASLLSDMESFKAANPGSILEDFIRWYSPRDWIETDGEHGGELSGRMQIADNFWVQTWRSAQPVPASRQKRLFDDTREAEKVLHYLESRTPAHIAELLGPVLAHAAIYRLGGETPKGKLHALVKAGERISREGRLSQVRIEGFVQEVTALEMRISQAKSLSCKLGAGCGMVERLADGFEVEVEGREESDVGQRMVGMFGEVAKAAGMEPEERKQSVFPATAVEKEVVLRVSVPRPKVYSSTCPQMMRAVLGKDEFRLCGAFAEDVMFF